MNGDQEQLHRYLESGDVHAFEALVAKYLPVVLSTAQRRCGDRRLAEEAAQNTFAILARKARSLVSHPTIGGWLHRTAMFEAGHLERSERIRRHTMKKMADEQTTTAENFENTPSYEQREEIDRALSKLRSTDRDVLLLRFFEGLSFPEIGQRLGKSDRAVRKQSERALNKMRGVLVRSRTALPCSVAAALAGHFTKSDACAASIATNALAASPSVPMKTITTNTILTMSYLKPAMVAVLLLLALWPISHALRNKDNGEPKSAQNTPVEQVQSEDHSDTDSSTQGDEANALATSVPDSESEPDSDSDAVKQRAMGRALAGIRLRQRVFVLSYPDGAPDPKSELYPEYVADMNSFMRTATKMMSNPPISGVTFKNSRVRGPESLSRILTSMVTAALDLDSEDKKTQSRLKAVFKAAAERRERDSLRRRDRTPDNKQVWKEGMVAWRNELYAELAELLSADEVAQIKSRLGLKFVDDPMEFGSGTMGLDKKSDIADPTKIASELEALEKMLAAEGGNDIRQERKIGEREPLVIPDIDQLGSEIAKLFRGVQNIDTGNSETVGNPVDQWSAVVAGGQVHREALQESPVAASLVGGVIAEVIDATPEEAQRIGEIVLAIREDADAAAMFEPRPEDAVQREQWSAKRKEFIEASKAQLSETVSQEKAAILEKLHTHWNPLVDLQKVFGM